MALPLIALPLLAAAVQTAVPPQNNVLVTGRGGVPFITPLGEPIRARTPNEDTLARWFNQVDLNHDGVLTPDELQADATRYFAILDTNHDGQIDPDELVHYEWHVAPEIQVNSRLRRARAPGEPVPKEDAKDDRGDGAPGDHRRQSVADKFDSSPQGAARYGLINMPEPVAQADLDFNRSITLAEFRRAALDRFQVLDTGHLGRLTLAQLEAVRTAMLQQGSKRKKGKKDEEDTRVGVPLPPGS